MNNVIPFRGRVAAPAAYRMQVVALNIQASESVRAQATALIATWRRNPVSGRLECRWTSEPGTNANEGVSRDAGHFKVA